MITASWKPLDPDIRDFLTEFQRRGDESEADDGGYFAEQFLTTDPNRAAVVTRAMLIASLPARRKMFEAAGVGTVRCVDASQLDLDEYHVLVTTDWEAERPGNPSLRLESTYLLRREADGPRVVVYLNHRDLTTLLASDQPHDSHD